MIVLFLVGIEPRSTVAIAPRKRVNGRMDVIVISRVVKTTVVALGHVPSQEKVNNQEVGAVILVVDIVRPLDQCSSPCSQCQLMHDQMKW